MWIYLILVTPPAPLTVLKETCSLDSSGDHLLHLDSPILSSELQNTSNVESVESDPVPESEDLLQLDSTSVSSQDTSSFEIEFVSESEGQLDNANLSPADVFSNHMTMNCSYYKKRYQESHVCEKLCQDVHSLHI